MRLWRIKVQGLADLAFTLGEKIFFARWQGGKEAMIFL